MDLFLAISQGIGLSIATGLRPYLPPLLAGALARADAGFDFTGSDFSFLESIPFLAVLVLLAAAATVLDRRQASRAVAGAVALLAMALGALEFAGSLAGEDHAWGAGLPVGAACALLAFVTVGALLRGARERLEARGERSSSSFLALWGDGAALVVALASVLFPPLAYVALAFCAWALAARRRRAGEKYEGLRVLR
jgi:uncharacterized membrane protein YwaF